jgi:hypothetical protein
MDPLWASECPPRCEDVRDIDNAKRTSPVRPAAARLFNEFNPLKVMRTYRIDGLPPQRPDDRRLNRVSSASGGSRVARLPPVIRGWKDCSLEDL